MIAENDGRGAYIPEVLFQVKSKGTMSSWLPKVFYKLPWLKLKTKDKYDEGMEIIKKKHNI